MPTNDSWQIPLPDPQPNSPTTPDSFADEVDQVLREVARQVSSKYGSHGIEAAPTKTTRLEPDESVVLNYALYLSFPAENHFSYRLFELVSSEPNGGLPVEVQAFSGPPKPFGKVSTSDQLKKVIDQIFADSRTRWLINTYYKP